MLVNKEYRLLQLLIMILKLKYKELFMRYKGPLILLKNQHPALKLPAHPVQDITVEIKQLVLEMSKLMALEQGIGLAAPQVGKHIQILLIDTRTLHAAGEFYTMLNPEILHEEGSCRIKEGCLSFPGRTVNVTRSRTVKVKYLTINGTYEIVDLRGWEARVFLHEYDHLLGKVMLDYE